MAQNLNQLAQAWVKRRINEGMLAGRIGMPTGDGTYTIEVPNRPHWVYVRIGEDEKATIIQAINYSTPNDPLLDVVVDYDRNGDPYVVGPNNSLAAEHLISAPGAGAGPHSHRIGFGLEDAVEARRFEPGLVTVNSSMTVYAYPTHYRWDGTDYYFAGDSIDLTSNVPATTNKWAWVKVGIDPSTNELVATTGTEYSVFYDLSITQLNDIAFTSYIPLGGVKLRNGQTAITAEADFADCRLWTSGAGSSGTADSGTFVGGPGNTLAISSNEITVSGSYHLVSGTADLNTINGGSEGYILVLTRASGTQPTIKHLGGNIKVIDNADVPMTTDYPYLLVYRNSYWWLLNPDWRHLRQSSDTDTAPPVVYIRHNTNGTPADGLGGTLRFQTETSTSVDQTVADITAEWATVTHASRIGRLALSVWDYYGNPEGIRIEGDGAGAAKLGFFGVTAADRPAAYTQTYSTAAREVIAYTADDESGAYSGIDNAQAGTPYAQLDDLNALRVAYENLRADHENLKQVVGALIDDAQSLGLAQ